MMIKEMIRTAASVPTVPFWSQLVACLVMAGAKIVPEDLWDVIGKKIQNSDTAWCELAVPGFTTKENHARSESHELWSVTAVQDFGHEPNDEKTVWVIPINELACLAENNDTYDDFVSIYRLFFAGTEEELRTAITAWLAS